MLPVPNIRYCTYSVLATAMCAHLLGCKTVGTTDLKSQGSKESLPLNGSVFVPDYGEEQVEWKQDGDTIAIKLSPNVYGMAKGARLKAPAAKKGEFCATVETPLVAGTCFAIYVSSHEPSDRSTEKWDELDFEFIETYGKSSVWVNGYHDGKAFKKEDGYGARKLKYETVDKKRYCISWDITHKNPDQRQALWKVEGTVIKEHSLRDWVKPLHPYISYWGGGLNHDHGGLSGWLGGVNRTEIDLFSHAKDIEYIIFE